MSAADRRRWLFVWLFAAQAFSVGMCVYGASIATISNFLQVTSSGTYQGWIARAYLWSGLAGLAAGTTGIALYVGLRRRHGGVAVRIAWTTAAIVSVFSLYGAILAYQRRHPIAAERRIAASFPLAASLGSGTYRVRELPESLFRSRPEPPRVDRILMTDSGHEQACAEVDRAVASWGGLYRLSGALHGCGAATTSPEGWSVVVRVWDGDTHDPNMDATDVDVIAAGMTRIVVEVATPGQ